MNPLYLTLLLLWIGHFLVDYMIGVWAVYKTIAGLDVAIAGLIAGLSAFAGEGMQLVFGSLSDRGHRRLLIMAGLAVTTASAFMAYTDQYSYLFLLFMLTCIGSGAFHPAAAGLAGMLSKEKKSFFMAIFISGGSLGLALSQIIFVSAYEFLHGQTAFLVIPTLCLVAFLAFYGLAEVPGPRILPGRGVDLKAFGRFFKHQALRNLYLIQLCTQALFWGVIFLLPDFLTYRDYPEWVSLGGGHLCLVLGSAFMIIPGGYLADRYSPKKVLQITQLAAVLLYAVILAYPHFSPILLCTLLFFLGAFLGLVPPLVLAMGSHLVPTRPGMVSAFLMGLVWCVAEGIGQGGGGLLTKVFTDNATANSLAVLGILLIGSLTATSRLPAAVLDQELLEFT